MSWHSKTFTKSQYEVVEKLLKWPNTKAFPVLDFLRILVLHPHAATTFGKIERDKKTNLIDQLIEFGKTNDPVNCLLVAQTLANCFNRRALAKLVASKYEQVFDLLVAFNNMKEKPGEKTEDQKKKEEKRLQTLHTAGAGVLINYSTLFLEDFKLYEGAKVHCLTTITEQFEGKVNPAIAYRLLVVLGTLIYADDNLRTIAADLETGKIISSLSDKLKKSNISEVVEEINTELNRKST